MSSSIAANRARRGAAPAASAAPVDPSIALDAAERRPRRNRREQKDNEEDNAAAAPRPKKVSAAAARRAAAAEERAAALAADAVGRDNTMDDDDDDDGDVPLGESDPTPADIQAHVDELVAKSLARHADVLAGQRAAAAVAPATSSSSSNDKARGQVPKGVNTDKYKGIGGLELDAWITRQRRQLLFFSGMTAEQAVTWLGTALEDAAGDWYDEYAHANGAYPSTSVVLFDGLRKRFQPIDSAETARRDLDVLRQAKGSVNEYTTRFRQLVGHLPKLDVDSRMYQYRRGLRKDLSDKIAQIVPQPATLEAIVELAARIEGRSGAASEGLAQVDVANDSVTYSRAELNALIQSAVAAAGARQAPGGAPYDSRRNRGANKGSQLTPLWKLAGLTREEGDRRRSNNLCMWCAGTAHIYRDCLDRLAGKPARVN